MLINSSGIYQVIYGTLLGDATIYKNGRYKFVQKDHKYCKYVSQIISKKYNGRFSIYHNNNPKHYNHALSFITNVYPDFIKYRNDFYKNNIKTVPEYVVKNINLFGLSFLIMDDGGWSKKLGFLRISTQCFSYKDNLKIKSIFYRLTGANAKIDNKMINGKIMYQIRFSAPDSRIVANYVKKFIIKSMTRKVGGD